jgi:uncharacterized membrane protein YgaE (UPF0421/DUF939 family)
MVGNLSARVQRALQRALQRAVNGPRLLLAAKTALAVGIAWAVAPHMPGVTDMYPYYAPLGALVSMYPTLMGSVRSGLQTLLGLATGIVLATVVVMTAGPSWWSIPLIVGVGVVIAGTGWFGAGREYVPMAALFVLIIGGPNADRYSLGYLLQMGVGVVVGVAVNFLVAPRISSAAAGARIDTFQQDLAAQLRQICDALEETWPPEHADWSRHADDLDRIAAEVRAELTEADESRKGNPRALLHRRDILSDHEQLQVLDRIVFHIRDISGVLTDTIWSRPGALTFDIELREPLDAACRAVADAIAVTDPGSTEGHRALGEAFRQLRLLVDAVDARTVELGRAMGPGVLIAMHLRRILMHLQTRPPETAAR